jgi:ATP-dependent protease ClpP protease subunit
MPRHVGANSEVILRKPARASAAFVPHSDYRPDPSRSIFVSGQINQDLVYSLTPSIIRLQHENRSPITVYIDSPGGSILAAGSILRLLKSPARDSSSPCRLITVVTSLAASSAAILLAAGDYAIAFPDSLIHFHGTRTYRQDAITVEEAADVAKDLKASNEASAVSLARVRSRNFFFRFITLREGADAYRANNPKATTEKDCFVGMVSEKLTRWGREVIQKADRRNRRYDALSARMFKSPAIRKQLDLMEKGTPKPDYYRNLEAKMLAAIIAFEISSNKKNLLWTFERSGMAQVSDDFFLLTEYIGQHKNDWIEGFCEEWKDFILQDADKDAIEALPEEQRKSARVAKLAPVLLPLWLFFGSICHVLQEAENPLTPTDAFWLGLVDDIIGESLPTLRKIAEHSPRAS